MTKQRETVRLGISTCPNDTFAFAGLISGHVQAEGIDFDIQLHDIQQLNELFRNDAFDVAKVSFFAALKLTHQSVVLPSGSALGYGVGPLLLASKPETPPVDSSQLTLCPGIDTTANLLFALFYPHTTRVEQVVFSDIMPRLSQREADFGVCIHEGRFTWQEQGLHLIEDLGTRWETSTDCPLPLGGILASRKLPTKTIAQVQKAVRDSLRLAMHDPQMALPIMRKYAQEFDDDVLMKHVELYVNQWTVELGGLGRHALDELALRAKEVGVAPADQPPFEVFDGR